MSHARHPEDGIRDLKVGLAQKTADVVAKDGSSSPKFRVKVPPLAVSCWSIFGVRSVVAIVLLSCPWAQAGKEMIVEKMMVTSFFIGIVLIL